MIQRLSEKQCFNGTHVNFVSENLSFCKQLNGLTVPDQDTHLSVVVFLIRCTINMVILTIITSPDSKAGFV